ncbi:MAG: hypothetical protein ACT4O6_06895 [Reyranella sp.]
MGIQIYPTVRVAQPEAEPWPVDEHTIRIDEMFARQLDTEFSSGVRALLHAPDTGVAAQTGEAALEAIADALPALNELKERTLSQAMGPRQRSILEPLIETRLDWAAGTLGRLAESATIEVDDASVADRIAGLRQDAAPSWHDPAYLRRLGRTAVEELRYQGERRGWDQTETDTRARSGLSDLYAGAVETAIRQDDLDGASALYDQAREVIAPERQAAIDRRFVQAREAAVYRDVDRDLAGIPLDPAEPPGPEIFKDRAVELTPDDATDEARSRIATVAEHAHRHAERRWNKQQAEAGVAALGWVEKNPGASFVAIPLEFRDWLAPDQWRGLEALFIDGRLTTDRDLFERLDRQMIYEPDAFVGVDLDRHRLSLDDEDHARFAAAQKAIAGGRIDSGLARHVRMRRGIDRSLTVSGIDTDGPVAATVRAEARDRLKSFEVIEGRPPNGRDIDAIVDDEMERYRPEELPDLVPSPADPEESKAGSTTGLRADAVPPPSDAPEVTRFDDGTRLVTRPAVETDRGKADLSEAYDEHDRIASVTATFDDGHRVESRWSYPGGSHWSQVDTVRSPEGEVLGTATTTFDGERVMRVAEPTDGPPQTEVWDKDGPVATVQNVVAPVLVIPFLLDLTAAAIGAVIVGKAIDHAINQPGAGGAFGGSEMALPTDRKPGKGHNNPPEPVDDDKRPPSGPPVPPFPPGQRPSWQKSELDDETDRQPNFAPRVAFKDGKEVSSRMAGSVRPDGVSADRRSASFEVKNYDTNTNPGGLVNNVVRQVLERTRHLPPGMQQNIKIDIRGQNASFEQLENVARKIIEKSNGLLRSEHIRFVETVQ